MRKLSILRYVLNYCNRFNMSLHTFLRYYIHQYQALKKYVKIRINIDTENLTFFGKSDKKALHVFVRNPHQNNVTRA